MRRGKFLWLPIDGTSRALLVHLGMSGQLLVRTPEQADDGAAHLHLRVRFSFADGGTLDFVDQRTFGYVVVEDLIATPDGAAGGIGAREATVPASVAHIARDLLDPALEEDVLVAAIRRRRTGIKRALLDQSLVSGIGNIYADEALWLARVHPERATDSMAAATVRRVLDAAREVMQRALVAGGTSFDALYVNVNGASGYFSRSLHVYGRQGEQCHRCGTVIKRIPFGGRSSHFCPRCQRRH